MTLHSRSLWKHVGAALLVGVAVLLLNMMGSEILGVYANGAVAGREPFSWLPRARTVGTTVVAYQLALSAITYLVAPAVIFGLGYRLGTREAGSASET
ncbi:hypothetical protein C2R22_22985 (plasmid) [Salinigranum rubrum]|uniref:Uncharacterized protein n=1 Tax=Salinigranum rubrum TaxID=755307 RepID=A0A2I8VTA2_9EURY|nr:hypothetical protein [Salinigranum rubrum]AUV84409.1 hypothetical protein C2R22_22985 [Salinigranum rubrum]